MVSSKTYIISKESLNQALDYIVEFEERTLKFRQQHSNCNYELNLNQEQDKWKVEITINNE